MYVDINHYSIVNITQGNGSGKHWLFTAVYCIIIIVTCDLPVCTLFVIRVVHVLISEVELELGCSVRNAQCSLKNVHDYVTHQ